MDLAQRAVNVHYRHDEDRGDALGYKDELFPFAVEAGVAGFVEEAAGLFQGLLGFLGHESTLSGKRFAQEGGGQVVEGGEFFGEAGTSFGHSGKLFAQTGGDATLLGDGRKQEWKSVQDRAIDGGDPGCLFGVGKKIGLPVGRTDLQRDEIVAESVYREADPEDVVLVDALGELLGPKGSTA